MSQRRFQKSTIRDVAERAGVSPTTVSLHLKGVKGSCSPDTARRINEAVEVLQYRPSAHSV
ncbi:MAG: LacI family DNA-binding transcriptional regulator, partial [Fimbriimonadaceae bacterium]|nr:LacI family DNA-binding transcriptional regulator [Fimbriimonadaceae bacterium]